MTPPSHGADGRAAARLIVIMSVVAFWALLAWLVSSGDSELIDALLLSVLVTAVPGLAMAQVPLARGLTIERLPAYWSSIITLWLLGSACWLVGSRRGGPAAIGFVLIPVPSLLIWTLALTLAGLGLILAFRWLGGRLGTAETTLLKGLLPQTPRERRVFALLSFAAGIGEELAYRGYVIMMLIPLLGVWAAAAVSTLVFGLMHAYQGLFGIVRTTLMGGVLAYGFVASGSLIPPMIAHTAIDLVAGLVLADWLLATEAPSGVERSDSHA